ncbi:atrial natriuretic peptide receptor 1-like [Paramacrobiotus metropolitanus]|uniref:atrial natriuretic peptide receptor 1-like n=1 Tax=Paramacrobiotus metropolitanus TaxID=2943436 RepID=UPI002445FE0A|nr:atrial natriuretic peptide receptor 1-like [Paramacrobiotus metropolitanus]
MVNYRADFEVKHDDNDDAVTISIISVGNYYSTSISSFPYVGPALDMGLETLRTTFEHFSKRRVIFDHTYVYGKQYHTCESVTDNVDHFVAEYYYNRESTPNMTAFIAPGCTERINLAKLVQGWNCFMMVGGNGEPVFRDKALFPNLVLAGENAIQSYVNFFSTLLHRFHWKDVYIVLNKSAKPFHTLLAPSLHGFLRTQKDISVTFSKTGNDTREEKLPKLLENIKISARVVIYLGLASDLRNFLLLAQSYGMANGDYAYFAVEPFKHKDYGNISWQYYDGYDEAAQTAYKSLFVITAASDNSNVSERLAFYKELKFRSKRDYNFSYADGEQPNPFVVASFESLLMFGNVLLERLNETGFDLADGSAFASEFWNRSFVLPYSGNVQFDDVGERQTNLVMQQFMNNSTDVTDILIFNDTTSEIHFLSNIQWNSVWPIKNEPECGFLGTAQRCRDLEYRANVRILTSSIVGSILVICCMITGAMRSATRKAIIPENNLWEVKGGLIRCLPVIMDADRGKSIITSKRRTRYSGIASLKGTKVWVEYIAVRQQIKLTKKTETLLTIVYNCVHPNVNRFIGLAFEEGLMMLISEYCKRGTLKDAMESQSVTLDWIIKLNFISDLAQAVRFIHSSSLGVHGFLKSSRCLISNHFTLQVAELGHDKIVETVFGTNPRAANISFTRRESVWIAPEMLYYKNSATPEMDIYAIGVIIQELVHDTSAAHLSLSSLRNFSLDGGQQRKNLPIKRDTESRLIYMSKRCLSANPMRRPRIKEIIELIVSLRGKSPNSVFEELLNRLEHHTGELENAVNNRTDQIMLEKEECDKVLHELLPKSIVEQLRTGESIKPEYYEQMTACFCHIFGFPHFADYHSAQRVTKFLSEMFILYDETIQSFDAFKLESSGESLIVVSGVPMENGLRHAVEICRFAIQLRKKFTRRYYDNHLQLQMGIDTGSCVTAVLGFKVPRYNVIGETMNVASRLANSGKPSRIQVNQTTVQLVMDAGADDLRFLNRGLVDKGTNSLQTFWLEDKVCLNCGGFNAFYRLQDT